MNVYACFNGWMGNGPVCVLVKAGDIEQAREMASEELRKDSQGEWEGYTTITEVRELDFPLACELDA